jgi:hypothetical protein
MDSQEEGWKFNPQSYSHPQAVQQGKKTPRNSVFDEELKRGASAFFPPSLCLRSKGTKY